MTNAESKGRNKRWRVTAQETSFLEAVFMRTRKPSRATIDHLAKSLNVRPRQVQVWFQNRRQRWRKEFSTAPTSPDGAGTDGDNVQPESLDAIMRQFIDAPSRRDDGADAGSESAGDLDAKSDSGAEEDDVENDAVESSMIDDMSPWTTNAFGTRASSVAEDPYLENLASLIDLSASGDTTTASTDETATDGDVEDAQKSWIGMDWLIDDSNEYATPEYATPTPKKVQPESAEARSPAAAALAVAKAAMHGGNDGDHDEVTSNDEASTDASDVSDFLHADLLGIDPHAAKAAEIASYLEGVCAVLAI